MMTQQNQSIKSLFTFEMMVITFVIMVAFFSAGLLSPILPLFMQSKGLNAETIGLMFSVSTIGMAISEVFWGRLVDRIDPRIATLMASLLFGIVIAGFYITETVAMLTGMVFIYGFSRSPSFIVGRWYMGVYAPEGMKVVAMSFLATVSAIALSLSGFASGYVEEAWGFKGNIGLSAAASIGAGTVILITWKRMDFKKPRQTPTLASSTASQPATTNRNIRLLMLFLGLLASFYFICVGVLVTYLPLFAADVILLKVSQIGVLFAVRGIVQLLTTIPSGRLADRMDKWLFGIIGMGCTAISMFGMALARDYATLIIATVFFSLGTALFRPTSMAIISEKIPQNLIGTAMGFYGLMEDVGLIVGSAVGGILWASWGEEWPFLFASIAGVVGMFIFIAVRRILSRITLDMEISAVNQD